MFLSRFLLASTLFTLCVSLETLVPTQDSEFSLGQILKKNSSACIRALESVDRHAKSVLVMDGNTMLPKNESLREGWCGPLKKLTKEAQAYLKCATPFVGQVSTILVNGLKKPIKYICKGNFERSRKHYACMDDKYLAQITAIESKLVDAVYTLNSNGSRDIVLPGLCCYVNRLLDEVVAIKHDACPDAGANPNKFLRDRIDEAIGDVLDLVCGPYPNAKICQETQAPVLAYLDQKATGTRDLTKTPFIPVLLQVMASLAAKDE